MSVCMFVYAIVTLYVKSTNKITIVHICCVCVCYFGLSTWTVSLLAGSKFLRIPNIQHIHIHCKK